MSAKEKRIPLSNNVVATKAEIEGYLKSLVEEYKKMALDVPDHYLEFPLYRHKMRIIGAITRAKAYFFFVSDDRLAETIVRVEDTATLPQLTNTMDLLKPHYREVAEALGVRQALFYYSKEAIKGAFNYDIAKKHALDLVKEHYAVIENKEKFSAKSFEDVPLSKQIFVVHGHDIEMRETVARTLEKLGLTPVILAEQANKGLTVIEKFIKNSNVAFAVVLLSPDDRGAEKIKNFKEQKLRARQNAIFELGFFIGKLRREQVFVLYRPDKDFEFPSDYHGEAYSSYDNPSGQWRLDLIQELQENGYPVDANKLTRQCDKGT